MKRFHSFMDSISKSFIIPLERTSNLINICFNVFAHCLNSSLKSLLSTCGFMNIPNIIPLAISVVCISPTDRSELRDLSSEMYFLLAVLPQLQFSKICRRSIHFYVGNKCVWYFYIVSFSLIKISYLFGIDVDQADTK